MAGTLIDAGRATVRSPRPLIVTTPFALETDVDEGAGGRVDVVVGVAAPVGWLDPEHAAANAIDAANSATRRHRRLVRSSRGTCCRVISARTPCSWGDDRAATGAADQRSRTRVITSDG